VKRLENELRDALNKVHAEDALKRKTSEFLRAEIAGRERGGLRFRPRLAAVCAVFTLFVIIGGFSAYFMPTTHIDFDVNPSVGLTLNRFGIVIDAAAYNDAGAEILQSVNIKNRTYAEAFRTLLDTFISSGYLREDGLVSATVQTNSKDREAIVIDKLTDIVDLSLSGHHISAEIDLFPVDAEVMNTAHGHHMTPAKYIAITELQAVDPTATFEGCAEHSIGEIRELTQEGGGEHHGEGNADSAGQSSDDGGQEHETDDGCEEAGRHDESGGEEQDKTAPVQHQSNEHHSGN
jgi:hypothetical protein